MTDDEDLDDAPDNRFLISWCMEGLEGIVDVNGIAHEEMIARLKGNFTGRARIDEIIHSMVLRAKVNTQRRYEIYMIETDSNITEDIMRRYFDDNPQGIVDLIRRRGTRIYSDRQRKQPLIT
jgi:hypothetical protein